MPRVNVWIPDALHTSIRRELPELNLSAAVQAHLAGLLGCRHDSGLVCSRCATPVNASAIAGAALERFYSDALWELDPLVRRGATAEGAARVLKGVAERHRVPNASIPLPRPTRAERQASRVVELPQEAESRAHHPTARRATA